MSVFNHMSNEANESNTGPFHVRVIDANNDAEDIQSIIETHILVLHDKGLMLDKVIATENKVVLFFVNKLFFINTYQN